MNLYQEIAHEVLLVLLRGELMDVLLVLKRLTRDELHEVKKVPFSVRLAEVTLLTIIV